MTYPDKYLQTENVIPLRIDESKVLMAARKLDFGGVLINETPTYRADNMPYGGIKDSGNTKEGPAHAAKEMTIEKLVVINEY